MLTPLACSHSSPPGVLYSSSIESGYTGRWFNWTFRALGVMRFLGADGRCAFSSFFRHCWLCWTDVTSTCCEDRCFFTILPSLLDSDTAMQIDKLLDNWQVWCPFIDVSFNYRQSETTKRNKQHVDCILMYVNMYLCKVWLTFIKAKTIKYNLV